VAASNAALSPRTDAAHALGCALARDAADLEQHFRIRRQVFVDAQGLFVGDDRDARDDDPATLHAVGLVGDRVAGAVRLYRLAQPGLWKGDRLAVLPASRAHQLGALLVRFAVATAGELGGERMVAQIQLPNVRFFERLGWRHDGDAVIAYGVPHQPMAIVTTPDRSAARPPDPRPWRAARPRPG
jgi:putative N-acetyltransferase (TIGR04045 family)